MKEHNLQLIKDEKTRAVVSVLLECEMNLSDGYGYYCELYATEQEVEQHGGDATLAALVNIAKDIIEAIR